ncbi:hypothetical protein [Vibrio superstes]|uniref:DUF3316 domain-containing protein n=1 Tax=Vibrio superstes NBRC 103154 TaxID=1219062 RepID=A0A511QXG5_9VIBR|nr:hypothetical protein [Vibrio superstes]GEM81212.1 hypothetical protein VSU01S_34570 [Vibrio superstes NBRC 103154]
MKNSKLTLTTVALLSSLALSQGVMAKNITNDQNFADQMSQVEQVFQSGDVFIASDSASSFSKTDVALDIQTELKDIYVTKQEAQDLGLTEAKSFNVYSAISSDKVSATISKMVRKDAPEFFTVDLYSNQMGQSDMVEYVAKVTEYN